MSIGTEASIEWQQISDGSYDMRLLAVDGVGNAILHRRPTDPGDPGTVELMALDPLPTLDENVAIAKQRLFTEVVAACQAEDSIDYLEIIATGAADAGMFKDFQRRKISFELCDEPADDAAAEAVQLPGLTLDALIQDFGGVVAQLPPDDIGHPQRTVVIRAQL